MTFAFGLQENELTWREKSTSRVALFPQKSPSYFHAIINSIPFILKSVPFGVSKPCSEFLSWVLNAKNYVLWSMLFVTMPSFHNDGLNLDVDVM